MPSSLKIVLKFRMRRIDGLLSAPSMPVSITLVVDAVEVNSGMKLSLKGGFMLNIR